MKANLYIKGLKDPIELEEDEARVAQDLIQDSTKPIDTPFVIEGIWAGRKADMKFVMFAKEDKRTYSSATIPMTDLEAVNFKLDINKDREKSQEVFGHEGFWELFFCERKGATRVEIIDIPERGIKSHQIYVIDPVLFPIVERQVASFKAWQTNKEYAEQARLRELDKMSESVADSMRIENEPS